jgi:ABC-type transport system, involved in lipoprotein release, permease component
MPYIFKMTFANLKRKRFRTWLTILGITIGTMSMVILVTAGIGARKSMLDQVEMMGSTRYIHVYSPSTDRKDRLLTDELVQEFTMIKGVKSVYPVLVFNGEESIAGYNTYLGISGYPMGYIEQQVLSAGEYPSAKGMRPNLIIGGGAKTLFYNDSNGLRYIDTADGGKAFAGKKLDLIYSGENETENRVKLAITGETENPYDYIIYTDIDTLKMFARRNAVDGHIPGQPLDKNGNAYNVWAYSEIIVEAERIDDVERISEIINDRGFQAENSLEMLNRINRITSIVQLVLTVIGSVAAVVAVIGIINTMTTAVYDRMTEIGLLKMIGADKDDLIVMFLFESALLGGIGGTIGVILSYAAEMILNKRFVTLLSFAEGTNIFVMPLWLALSAIAGAILVSIIACAIPVRWVSNIKPLEAIQ